MRRQSVPMVNKDELGRAGEDRAAEYLHSLGYRILDRNWRGSEGELDIVATIDDELVVVEVKTRRTVAFGHPLEAIDGRKQRRLQRLAFSWIAAHPDAVQGRRLRIDAVGIVGSHPDTAVVEHVPDVA